jgi:hypothetical protein
MFVAIVIALTILHPLPNAHAKVTALSQHVFAKGIDKSGSRWKPINVTDTFTQVDDYVYAFTSASFSSTNFTWRWHDPSGAVLNTDFQIFDCGGKTCEFYDRLPIRGKDAQVKLGMWKMDLLADGVVLYSDPFKLTGYVSNELAWNFDVYNPMRAHVNLTVTVHPEAGTWSDYWTGLQDKVGNFSAHEFGSNKSLLVSLSSSTWPDYPTKVDVIFDSPQGDGYKFTISFDLASGFGATANGYSLSWNWGTDFTTRPGKVTIILPPGFKLGSVRGDPKNYTTAQENGRASVSFAGTAPPYGVFSWIVLYQEIPASATLSSSSMTPSPTSVSATQPSLSALVGVVVGLIALAALAGLFIRRRTQRQR